MNTTNLNNLKISEYSIQTLRSFVEENVNMCFQCKKCAVGCPLVPEMDYTPSQIIHAARLGMKDLVLNSKTIWLCVACETCTTRCPQDVDIVKVMDAAKILCEKEKIKPPLRDIAIFNRSSLLIIRVFGRLYEIGMLLLMIFKTKVLFREIDLAVKMIKAGRLKFFPDFPISMKTNQIFSRIRKIEREMK